MSLHKARSYNSEHQQLSQSELKDCESTELKDGSAISDTSTIDNADMQTEEFQYLTGLDSDNLMKFSQQSAMQDLLNKENINIDVKPNLDVLPTLDEHDIGGYKFHLVVQPLETGKSGWVYSESLNKVYIRQNDALNFDVAYTPKNPFVQLRLRVMLCFVKDSSEPVLRCQNHISNDTDENPQKVRSLLRCENPKTEYVGSDTGRSINDRYSILVPLSMGVKPFPDKSVRQSIALKFTCQNSCLQRKGTSLILLLENMSGEIYAQRNLIVKVCSCPKRDRLFDEKKNKRKNTDDLYPRASKLVKEESNAIIKTDDLSDVLNSNVQFERKPNGSYRLVLETQSHDLMRSTLKDIMRETSFMLSNSMTSKTRKQNTKFYEKLKCAYDSVKKF